MVRVGWFVAVFLTAYWAMTLSTGSAFALWVREATASGATELLRLFGHSPVLSGCSIVAGDATTTVTEACLPVAALSVGVALVLASIRLTAAGKALWVPALITVVALANVGRIAIVAVLAQSHSPLLTTAHVHILPMAMVLSAIAVWLLAEWVGPHA